MMQEILVDLLRPFGISRRYRGFPMLIAAVILTVRDEGSRFPLTKNLYARIAEECDCPVHCVEKNIRTLTHRAWKVNRNHLQELAGYPLNGPPTASEFIDILASHVLRQHLVG